MVECQAMTLRAAVMGMLLGFAPVLAPGVAFAAPAGPQRVCGIGDKRLVEISGLVATSGGYVVVNDGSEDKDRRRIFFLDRKCSVTRTVSYPSRPRDTEDLALGADGTLWVADIGDNSLTRDTIGLWKLAPGAKSPKLYRLAYPDAPHNAEALLLTPAGTPIVVTKAEVGEAAALYVPDGGLSAKGTTPLRRVGTVTLPLTGTSNPFSLPGRMLVTGGAVRADGRRVVLRTYADAFEFDVSDGDVVAALTAGTPRTVALPDEPQGESIAYSVDGTTLLTVSEVADQPPGTEADLLSYPLATASPAALPSPASAAVERDGMPPSLLVAAGLLLVGVAGTIGAITARRARRRG